MFCGKRMSLLALLIGLAPDVAQADASSKGEEARAAYAKASAFFEADEYAAALPHSQSAYELSNHRPSTVLGLAQCERELEMYAEALGHFREYLATGLEPDETAAIESTIELLEEKKTRNDALEAEKKQQEALAAATAEPPPPEEEASLWANPFIWIGVAVALGAGAGVAIWAASGEEDPYTGNSGVVLKALRF